MATRPPTPITAPFPPTSTTLWSSAFSATPMYGMSAGLEVKAELERVHLPRRSLGSPEESPQHEGSAGGLLRSQPE